MTNAFFAKECTIKIDLSGTATVTAALVLDTAFSAATGITGQFKNVNFKPPVGDVDKVDLMGTTSDFQNAEIEEKPAGMCELSGTVIIPGDEMMEAEVFGAGTAAPAAGSTHTTYRTGLATRTKVEVLLNLDDSTDKVNFAIVNAYITQWDVKGTADGYFEADVTFKCLPRDSYGPQFKD